MRLKKWMQVVLIGASVVALAACSTKHKYGQSINDANDPYNSDAQTSGLGGEEGMNDQAADGQALSTRVYYFDFDSNVVRDEYMPAITANAHYLMSHPDAKVLVEGHTDPRGSREYNIGLGERRAKAVAAVLTAKGANRAQIRIVSYGAEKLASSGRAESDFQQDRRAVLVYLNQ